MTIVLTPQKYIAAAFPSAIISINETNQLEAGHMSRIICDGVRFFYPAYKRHLFYQYYTNIFQKSGSTAFSQCGTVFLQLKRHSRLFPDTTLPLPQFWLRHPPQEFVFDFPSFAHSTQSCYFILLHNPLLLLQLSYLL